MGDEHYDEYDYIDDDDVAHKDSDNDEDLVEVVVEDINGDQLLQLPHLLLAPVRGGEMLMQMLFIMITICE